jgi:hypothetical protein
MHCREILAAKERRAVVARSGENASVLLSAGIIVAGFSCAADGAHFK